MFTIRNFDAIALAEINHARATQDTITDFNIGSLVRTLLESPAVELDEFYQLMLSGILDAIPVAVYKAFDFNTQDPGQARGLVTLNFTLPIVDEFTIPVGTIFNSNTQSYLTETDTLVEQGATSVSFYVICANTGVQGNAQPNAITQVQNYILPNDTAITNEAITSGRDGETDAERMNRFANYVRSLVRGTLFSVVYAGSSAVIRNNTGQVTEYISRISPEESPGHVYLYIWAGNGAPSSALIAAAQLIVDGTEGVGGYRADGMRVEVLAMIEQPVDINLSVKVFPGNPTGDVVTALINTALTALIANVNSGGTLYAAAVVDTVLAITGIKEAYLDIDENVSCPVNTVLSLGALAVDYL